MTGVITHSGMSSATIFSFSRCLQAHVVIDESLPCVPDKVGSPATPPALAPALSNISSTASHSKNVNTGRSCTSRLSGASTSFDKRAHLRQRSEARSIPAQVSDNRTPLRKALLMRLVSLVNGVIRFLSSMFNVLVVFAPVGMTVRKSSISYYSIIR